jgi:integrase
MFYRAIWVPGRGINKKCLDTSDRSEAELLRKELLGALLREEAIVDDGVLPLGALWERYKTDCVAFTACKESYRLDVEGHARVLLAFFGQECDVRDLSERDQLAFTRKRLAGGIRLSEKKETGTVRMRSVQADVDLLHTILRWATTVRVSRGARLLDKNPLDGARRPRRVNPRRPVASWQRFERTRAAIVELAEVANNDSERTKWRRLELALVIAEATGRRLGSIRQLRWRDFDFERDRVRWRAEADKMGKEREAPLTPALREEMKAFRMKLGGAFGGLMFPAASDIQIPVRRDVLDRWLRAAEKKAGLPKLNGGLWHPYRRAWATCRKHLPMVDVAEAGGWSDVGTLLRCYQLPDDDTMLQVMGESRKVMERTKAG